jgi:WD40 repeat protein
MNKLMPTNSSGIETSSLSVTAISSRSDGLSYAIGTSTGHSLLYDIRSAKPYAIKDQGYGFPVKNVVWIEGGNKIAGDGMVLSADKKVIKIWDHNEVSVFVITLYMSEQHSSLQLISRQSRQLMTLMMFIIFLAVVCLCWQMKEFR